MAKSISPEEQKKLRENHIRKSNQRVKESYKVKYKEPEEETFEDLSEPIKPEKKVYKTKGNIIFLDDMAEFEYVINNDLFLTQEEE